MSVLYRSGFDPKCWNVSFVVFSVYTQTSSSTAAFDCPSYGLKCLHIMFALFVQAKNG